MSLKQEEKKDISNGTKTEKSLIVVLAISYSIPNIQKYFHSEVEHLQISYVYKLSCLAFQVMELISRSTKMKKEGWGLDLLVPWVYSKYFSFEIYVSCEFM